MSVMGMLHQPLLRSTNSEHNNDVKVNSKTSLSFAIVLLLPLFTFAQVPSEVMNTTICNIAKRPSAYDGKMVRIRAVYGGSFEGTYLVDSSCKKSVWFTTPEGNPNIAAVVVHSPYPQVPETTFQLVKDREYEKFTNLAYATAENLQPENEVTATFTGRIDHCTHFKLNKKGFGNGFGQMGRSELQLVLQSVSDVDAKEAKGILTPSRSTLPDHIQEDQ
jgi:hypothetical protein